MARSLATQWKMNWKEIRIRTGISTGGLLQESKWETRGENKAVESRVEEKKIRVSRTGYLDGV